VEDRSSQITVLLRRLSAGDREAENALVPLLYSQLHRMAKRQFRSEPSDHTLQPTALVNELYIRLIRDTSVDWQSRSHLFALAAKNMRRILVDHARERNAGRRPPRKLKVSLDDVFVYSDDRSPELLALHEALESLSKHDAQQARIAEMRFFAELTIDEVATVLGIAPRTVNREWEFARAWLARFMSRPPKDAPVCTAI
jgi:RNA polymerase sigma-70 factor, ECF subfamily